MVKEMGRMRMIEDETEGTIEARRRPEGLPSEASIPSSGPMYDFSVLRHLRKREGLTIQAVSEQSGISAAVISKLERNQSQGELETLFRLGRVFGLSAADLIGLAESRVSATARERDYQSEGFFFRRVGFANVTAFLGEAPEGARVTRPEIHRDAHEVCWVLAGRLRLALPHEVHELTAGESLQFDAIQEHTYEALEACRLLLLHLRKESLLA